MKQLFYFRLKSASFLTFHTHCLPQRQLQPNTDNEDQVGMRALFFKRVTGNFLTEADGAKPPRQGSASVFDGVATGQ
ncbi:hypothetical protein HMPREF0758_0156 [Serratia odorifera DSM 4582]|uniref:Uncharacterized protein n=1 Tax=Serratia odorifera DSM 4582 TaxID=667129 RepID=D4DW56_SEROD|nr:hypothetical protein HMPREF0758_0156 [Serratia odorifera DSM 4582]